MVYGLWVFMGCVSVSVCWSISAPSQETFRHVVTGVISSIWKFHPIQVSQRATLEGQHIIRDLEVTQLSGMN